MYSYKYIYFRINIVVVYELEVYLYFIRFIVVIFYLLIYN